MTKPSLDYTDSGKGNIVLLLHGFPFSKTLWSSFAEKLTRLHRVITIDLPGFGNSTMEGIEPFTIDAVGSVLISFLKEKKLDQIAVVGHSLGGYIALAMVEQNPTMFSGLVLFHSTAFADSEEKKQSRDKVIEFIGKNGVHAFTSNFITPLYANPQHPTIDKVRAVAKDASEDTVIAYTKAMKKRADRTHVLRNFHKPVLFIGGEKDQGITPESLHKQAALCRQADIHILPEVAHMGMFENADVTTQMISQFISRSNQH